MTCRRPLGDSGGKRAETPVRVLTPSHQPAPSKPPLSPFSLPTLSKVIPDDAPQRRGPGPPLHPLPFNPFTAAAPSRTARPAGLSPAPRACRNPPRGQEGGWCCDPSPHTRSVPSASHPSLSPRSPVQRPRYNGEPGCPGQPQGPECAPKDREDAGTPTPGTQWPSSASS